MTEQTRVLYEYTRSREMPKYLLTEEYREVEWAIRCQQEALQKLSPELYDRVDDLISEVNLERALELEAMFEAALALCQELSEA